MRAALRKTRREPPSVRLGQAAKIVSLPSEHLSILNDEDFRNTVRLRLTLFTQVIIFYNGYITVQRTLSMDVQFFHFVIHSELKQHLPN